MNFTPTTLILTIFFFLIVPLFIVIYQILSSRGRSPAIVNFVQSRKKFLLPLDERFHGELSKFFQSLKMAGNPVMQDIRKVDLGLYGLRGSIGDQGGPYLQHYLGNLTAVISYFREICEYEKVHIGISDIINKSRKVFLETRNKLLLYEVICNLHLFFFHVGNFEPLDVYVESLQISDEDSLFINGLLKISTAIKGYTEEDVLAVNKARMQLLVHIYSRYKDVETEARLSKDFHYVLNWCRRQSNRIQGITRGLPRESILEEYKELARTFSTIVGKIIFSNRVGVLDAMVLYEARSNYK